MENTKKILGEYLSSLHFPADLPIDGTIHRFARDGLSHSGWLVGNIVGDGNKNITYVTFGDWRTGEKYEWCGDSGNLTDLERTTLKEKYESERKQAEQEKIQMQKAMGEAAVEFLKTTEVLSSDGVDKFPYLKRKGINHTAFNNGATLYWNRHKLVVPMGDKSGVCNYQTISTTGEKMFATWCRVSGTFFEVRKSFLSGSPTYIAEGLATAMSIAMVVDGANVVVCFNAGNMEAVAKEFSGIGPIIYCADNDWKTTRQGKPYNTGLEAANGANELYPGKIIYPEFQKKDCEEKYPTDFNDYHVLYGLDKLKELLNQKELPAPTPPDTADFLTEIKNITKVEWKPNKKGDGVVPPEQNEIALNAVESLKHCLTKQDRDIFFYTGTHWEMLDMGRIDQLKTAIMDSAGSYTSSKMDGVYKIFLTNLPRVEVTNIFDPHTRTVNFLNGTLFLDKDTKDINKRALVFRTHNKNNYLLNCLPYEYLPENKERNIEFEEMLARVCLSEEGPEETQRKIGAIQMLFGACLAPDFPILYFLYGPPATGKSTIMKLLNRFMSQKNICSVEPSEFSGFNMESMAGKLVNMDADISLNKPIADSVVKKIIDRVPMRVQRKNRDDLYAPMPAVHVFGANELPRTMDRGSGAHQRRWVLVEFTNPQVKDNGPLNLNYDEYCYNISPQGILNFALEGLRKLCNSGGSFVRPETGIARLKEWESESNPVEMFIEDIVSGDVTDKNVLVEINKDRCSNRLRVWEVYTSWSESSNKSPLGRNSFYRELKKKKFKFKKINGENMIQGIKVAESKNADF